MFTEQDPAALYNLIRKEYFQTVMVFELVITDKNATKLRKNAGDRIRGVFVLDTRFCRGYDVKLGEDLHVLIMAGAKGFPLS